MHPSVHQPPARVAVNNLPTTIIIISGSLVVSCRQVVLDKGTVPLLQDEPCPVWWVIVGHWPKSNYHQIQ